MDFSFEHCCLCPRNCGVNRISGESGYCKSGTDFAIASICVHQGEEPVISGKNGICNLFFAHCNLQCTYCQNDQISRNTHSTTAFSRTLDQIIREIKSCLDIGCEAVGFVSPTHFSPHVHTIIEALHAHNLYPITLYNTNGYEKPEVLKAFEDCIDVYLPDLKYLNPELAERYSGASDYPVFAGRALKEIYRQKGSTLIINDNGQAIYGMVIRHLVLPGLVEESIRVLRWIAEELSPAVSVSLMAQYSPIEPVKGDPLLHRTITAREYELVVKEMESLGFQQGFLQEIQSADQYKPDFRKKNPFC